ncbi:XRP2-like protein [Achlya hypogyna]|uniref:XRP2-like protein n=1 Tax=Achlya hypogyna TaxID=1202772 RepID=A0A1V9Z027_ACHHY|nr:XRP2-like protein [Achlya hypogyna]
MGNAKTKPVRKLPRPAKSFDGSFGRDPTLNPADFLAQNLTSAVVVRLPGSIRGQQFVIEDCTQCSIFLLDHCTSVTIDHCRDCTIFVGPCTSSLFVRDCSSTTLVCIAQQFRTRDCKDMDISLFSSTAPIVETSRNLRIGCCRSSYFALQEQLDKSKFSIWNNKWSEVYDFTPQNGNWKAVMYSKELWPSAVQQRLPSELLEQVGYTEDATLAILPIIHGLHHRSADGDVAFLCISTGNSMLALDIAHLALNDAAIKLIQTRQFRVTPKQAATLFEKEAIHKKNAGLHDLIVMEWAGKGLKAQLQALLQEDRIKPHAASIYLNVERGREKCELCWATWKESI